MLVLKINNLLTVDSTQTGSDLSGHCTHKLLSPTVPMYHSMQSDHVLGWERVELQPSWHGLHRRGSSQVPNSPTRRTAKRALLSGRREGWAHHPPYCVRQAPPWLLTISHSICCWLCGLSIQSAAV